jgi:hypothetical protein
VNFAVLAALCKPDRLKIRPPFLLGLLLGIGSGAAMIPYSIIKEIDPDEVKGSATGAINFLVFTLSALLAPAYGWLLNSFAGGGKLTLGAFQSASSFDVGGVVLAIVLAFFIRETGQKAGMLPLTAKTSSRANISPT